MTWSPQGPASWRQSSRSRRPGLKVADIVVLVDREQGGRKELADKGLALHAVLTLSDLLDALVRHGRIDEAVRSDVRAALGIR